MAERRQKANRQAFGSTRQLPSGRWQARYPDPAGRPMTAPVTFPTKREALDHIAGVRADRMRGTYRDHRAGLAPLGPYAADWIANGGRRGKLAPKTRALYEDVLATQLQPLHDRALSAITPADVRTWYSRTRRDLLAAAKVRAADAQRRAKERGKDAPARPLPSGESRLRQAYSLLRAIMSTAVQDGLIAANPCQIVGAGAVQHPERPYLSPQDLGVIVAAMPARWHLPLRVMFGAHLRSGELIALQRGDYADGLLQVERQTTLVNGKPVTSGTKTGNARTVPLPPSIAAEVEAHLSATTGFPKSPMFGGPDGITSHGLGQAWRKAARSVGLGQFHVHDVRHAGLTAAAQVGATTRELMARAGHRTARAALIYQHAAEERNATLAAALDVLAGGAIGGATGTGLARGGLQALPETAADAVESGR